MPLLTRKTTLWIGFGNAFMIASSVGGVTQSWLHTRQPWTPQTFTFGAIWKTMCTQTIHKQFLISRQRLQLKSGRFQGKSASELSKTVYSEEEHIWNIFLSVNKTYIFQSTDFKLCQNIMHGLKSMWLKLGAGAKRITGIIQVLDMLLFFGSPCIMLYFSSFGE